MKTFISELRTAVLSTVVLAVVLCGLYPVAVWAVAQIAFHDKANGSLITDATGTVRGSRLLGQPFAADKYFISRPSAAGTGYDASSSSGSNLGPTSKKLLNGTVKGTSLASKEPGSALLPGPEVVEFDGLKLRVIGYCDQNGIAYQLMRDGKQVDAKVFKNAKGDYDQVTLIKAFNDDAKPVTVVPASPIPADAVTASASGLDPHISPRNAEIQAPRVAKTRNISLEKVKELITANTDKANLGVLGDAGVNVLTLNLSLDAIK